MDTVSPPHTRSRSRSKTPFVPTIADGNNAKDGENADRHVRKEPTVKTIQEDEEPAQTPPKRAKRETKTSIVSPTEGAATKIQTSVKVTTSTTKVVTRGVTNSQTSSSQETKESVNQKEFNRGLEGSQKISTPRNVKKPPGNVNGDVGDHIAYKEYRDAGEYWNKYPKTDYTYSKLSPHRREIIPGVIAMPNMSRKSLEKHKERVEQMIQMNPSQESYIRARYDTSRFNRSAGRALHYDSGEDEMDLSQFDRRKRTQVYRETILTRMYTRIITTIVTSWYWISSPFRSTQTKGYYTNTDISQSEKKSIFHRFFSAIGSSFLYVFQRIYLLIASIFLLDTWLLQTKVDGGRHKKKFLWFLIFLLPFLLFGGAYYFLEPPSTLSLKQFTNSLNSLEIDRFKNFAIDSFDGLKLASSGYIEYAKVTTGNLWDEVRKLWNENFSRP
uniref:Uncharacterized protein n=1 Tax=Nyssomyia neivai TaxID=330878 RepID=A0A1L8D9K9_9DIPT